MVDQHVKISKIGQIVTGTTPATSEPKYYSSKDFMFIGPADLGSRKIINSSEKYISKEGFEICRKLPEKSILVVCIGATIGKVGFLTEQAATNQQINSIIPFDNYDPDYVYYLLLSSKEILKSFAGDTATPILNKGDFSLIKLGVIKPLPEQKKIAAILSTVDEAIQNTKAQIEKTKELKRGLMQKLFTEGIGHTEFKESKLGRIPKEWEVERLGDLTSKVGSGITPKGGSSSYLNEGIPMIRSQNVVNGPINWKNMAYISKEQHDKMERSKLQPKDVLLNISGASIGRTAIVPDEMIDANVNQHVCIIRPIDDSLNPNFLKEFLTSKQGQEQIFRLQAGGNREGLNYQQLRDFRIPIPEAEEQLKISNIINEVAKKINALDVELQNLSCLKKGLMQKLLTGRLRVDV